MHKLKNDSTVDDLPMQPTISNINTASCQLAKYLAKLLVPLSMSEYNVKSTSDFITHIKGHNIPNNFKLISFHSFLPPLKLGGFLVFEIWAKRGVMKKLLRNRGVS